MSSSLAAQHYRHLLKQTAITEMMIALPNPGGLLQAVRTRYRQVVSKNLQLPLHQRVNIAKKQQVSFYRIMNALAACPDNETLSSIAVALSTGHGNEAYRSTLFRHFAETLVFDAERVRRDEVSNVAVADRQNRLMQTAVFPYLEKLCILNDRTLQNQQTSDSLLRALAPRRAGVTVQLFPAAPHFMAVEIDESLNKQTIYISSGDDDENDYHRSIAGREHLMQRVDSAQLELQRGTILHLEWMNRAKFCLDTLIDESKVHRSRGTVVVGHGVGGAVATALAVMLQAEQFGIRNVVTFGAPKVIEEIEDRHAEGLNSIRVVIGGDPLVNFPVSGAEGGLFHHVGELLVVHSKAAQEMFGNADGAKTKTMNDDDDDQENDEENENENEEVDAAEMLFAELNGTSSPPPPSQNNKTTKNSSSGAAKKSETTTMMNPFSSVAYRVALADPEAQLEYFEEDAGVWDSDDIRDANDLEEDMERERMSEMNRPT